MVYRTTPLPPLFTLRREVDRLFEDAFGRATAAPATWTPATDVREDADAYRFELELPGIAPELVEVTFEQGVLTVRGEKRPEAHGEPRAEPQVAEPGAEPAVPVSTESRKVKWHVVERVQGSFKRTFQLPQTIDEDRISASFANGLLTVVVPKSARPMARRIEVKR